MVIKIKETISNSAMMDALNNTLPFSVWYQTDDSETFLGSVKRLGSGPLTFESNDNYLGVQMSQFTHIEDYAKGKGLHFSSTKNNSDLVLTFETSTDADIVLVRLMEYGYIPLMKIHHS